jgi:hypothetical protein
MSATPDWDCHHGSGSETIPFGLPQSITSRSPIAYRLRATWLANPSALEALAVLGRLALMVVSK